MYMLHIFLFDILLDHEKIGKYHVLSCDINCNIILHIDF